MLPRTASKTDDDVANGTDDERVRSRAQRHRLERSRRPAPPCTVPGRTAVAANDSGFRRSARLRRCGGRGDLVGQDDDACADAACADARLAMLPRPHPPTVASEAVGPHRPTRSCELPDARRALGGGCEGLPELSECHGRACRAVLSGFDTLELLLYTAFIYLSFCTFSAVYS